jgi:hypothetical protein
MLIHEDLHAYFGSALREALRAERLDLDPAGFDYLVQVCVDFAERDAMATHETDGDPGTPTLAWMVRKAQSAPPSQRFEVYRSLGDVALVVGGLFAPHVERRKSLVGRAYYVDMGRTAYRTAAELARAGRFREVLAELAHHFRGLVEALTRVAEGSSLATVTEPALLVGRWQDDPGSPSAIRGLVRHGLAPVWGPPASA